MNHVLNVVLRHWDLSMRELGSQSLKNLCLLDIDNLAQKALQTVVRSYAIPTSIMLLHQASCDVTAAGY